MKMRFEFDDGSVITCRSAQPVKRGDLVVIQVAHPETAACIQVDVKTKVLKFDDVYPDMKGASEA